MERRRLKQMLALCAGAVGFTVAISGATGGLGRELCQQSVDRGWNTLALTRNTGSRVMAPIRYAGMVDVPTEKEEISSPLMTVLHHDDAIAVQAPYDALILALGGKPLKSDGTTRVVETICANLPHTCKAVCLVSAYGVGSSLEGSNVGIRLMESWYLQDVYAAKRAQENIVRDMRTKNMQILILRPKALSYGRLTPFDTSLPRKDLAGNILEWCCSSSLTVD